LIHISLKPLQILLENSHYGDHQPGKISQPVVTLWELMLPTMINQKNLLMLQPLWDHVLHNYQELME